MTTLKITPIWAILILILSAFLLPQKGIAQTNSTEANVGLYYGFSTNTYNGNLFYKRQDLSLPAIEGTMNFTFSYNSENSEEDTGYGLGWTMASNVFYVESEDGYSITIVRGNGREDLFYLVNGGYQSPTGNFETLTKSGTTVTLTGKYGKVTEFADATHGKVTKITDTNGNTVDFTYTGSDLTGITDSYGRQVQLSWQNGHLATLTDATVPSTPRTWTYQYLDDQLTKVTKPLGIECEYSYNDDGRMDSFTNENGRTLTFAYFPNGAFEEASITSSTLNFNKKVSYDISNLSAVQTIIEEQVAGGVQTTTYIHNAQKQLIQKTGNCCGYNRLARLC